MTALRCSREVLSLLRRSVHTATRVLAGGEWRLKQGQGACGNEYGPLRDTPDWSYADGRPAPPTRADLIRQQQKVEMCDRIVQFSKELQFAKDNYKQKALKKQEAKTRLLKKKLRPKVAE